MASLNELIRAECSGLFKRATTEINTKVLGKYKWLSEYNSQGTFSLNVPHLAEAYCPPTTVIYPNDKVSLRQIDNIMSIVRKEIVKTQGYSGPLGSSRRSSVAYAEYDYLQLEQFRKILAYYLRIQTLNRLFRGIIKCIGRLYMLRMEAAGRIYAPPCDDNINGGVEYQKLKQEFEEIRQEFY